MLLEIKVIKEITVRTVLRLCFAQVCQINTRNQRNNREDGTEAIHLKGQGSDWSVWMEVTVMCLNGITTDNKWNIYDVNT